MAIYMYIPAMVTYIKSLGSNPDSVLYYINHIPSIMYNIPYTIYYVVSTIYHIFLLSTIYHILCTIWGLFLSMALCLGLGQNLLQLAHLQGPQRRLLAPSGPSVKRGQKTT